MSLEDRRITADSPSTNKPTETLTAKEFNLWLQGVEEMQPSNWVPDERQWRIIRAKIQLLIDTPVKERIVTVPAPTPALRPFDERIGPGGNRPLEPFPVQTWSDSTHPDKVQLGTSGATPSPKFAPTPPAPSLGTGGSDFQ